MEFEITDKTTKEKLVNEKQKLICEYSKTLINEENANYTPILNFKNQLIGQIGIITGEIRKQNESSSNLNKLSEPYFINNNINNKSLTGTQLKKDIYEENTKLTMHLIYYVLGMGFMGYYIIKLLKK
jgi:hypothetical protein